MAACGGQRLVQEDEVDPLGRRGHGERGVRTEPVHGCGVVEDRGEPRDRRGGGQFVEIAHEDARPGGEVRHDGQDLVRVAAALLEVQPHVRHKDVNQFAILPERDAQQSTLLEVGRLAEQVGLRRHHLEARDKGVAVVGDQAGREQPAEDARVARPQPRCDLLVLLRAQNEAADLVQPHHVRRGRTDHGGDPVIVRVPVGPHAGMHVVHPHLHRRYGGGARPPARQKRPNHNAKNRGYGSSRHDWQAKPAPLRHNKAHVGQPSRYRKWPGIRQMQPTGQRVRSGAARMGAHNAAPHPAGGIQLLRGRTQ